MSFIGTNTAFLFSGQGSQYVGMASELSENFLGAKRVFECAEDILGYRLTDICFTGPAEELNKTIHSQPAIMACSLAAFEAASEEGINFSAVAGHSLGEYAAMVASKMVSCEDGFRLIKARAQAMQNASEQNKGAMCAIIGLPSEEIERVCSEVDGYAVAVNYNSPVQTVIAGEEEAVARAIEILSAQKARCMRLNVSSAFHSALMKPAADEFIEAAKKITFAKPCVSFYSNVMGEKLIDFSDMPGLLSKHIISPVRFTDELSAMREQGIECFVELGPGKVLTGLVKKTFKDCTAVNIEDMKSLEKALEA